MTLIILWRGISCKKFIAGLGYSACSAVGPGASWGIYEVGTIIILPEVFW